MRHYYVSQGHPTFFSRGPSLLLQYFGEPKFIVHRFFCQKVGEDQKKRCSLRFDRCFLPKSRWRPKIKKKRSSGLRSDLIGVLKRRFCGIFLQLTISLRKHQSTNQRKNLWWAILKPLAGHFWPAGWTPLTYLLRLPKHQYLKRSIYFCVKVGRNHRRDDVNHLSFLQNSKKCFGIRSIDKFSFRISTRRIILVVEGRECDKQIDYFRAIRAGTELHRSWILYVIVL